MAMIFGRRYKHATTGHLRTTTGIRDMHFPREMKEQFEMELEKKLSSIEDRGQSDPSLCYHAHTRWTLTLTLSPKREYSYDPPPPYTHKLKFNGQSVQKIE